MGDLVFNFFVMNCTLFQNDSIKLVNTLLESTIKPYNILYFHLRHISVGLFVAMNLVWQEAAPYSSIKHLIYTWDETLGFQESHPGMFHGHNTTK